MTAAVVVTPQHTSRVSVAGLAATDRVLLIAAVVALGHSQ
jgi:hypothetical protein